MVSSSATICQLCEANSPAKYKCPKCRIPYCSVACYKIHKAEPCQPPPTPPPTRRLPHRDSNASRKRRRDQGEGYLDEIDDHPEVMEELPLLTDSMKSSLMSDPAVKAALADPTLLSLLREIDGSERRAHKLKEATERYPPLGNFTDTMLRAVGALTEDETGQLCFCLE